MSDILGTEPCIKCGKNALADSVLCPRCFKNQERAAASSAATSAANAVPKPEPPPPSTVNPTEQLANILVKYIKKEGVTLKPKTEMKIKSALFKGIQDAIFKQPKQDQGHGN